jgi:hypothetical protein
VIQETREKGGKKARLLMLTAASAMAAALVALVWLSLRPKVLATQRLPDGSTVSYLGQTYGDRPFDPAPPLVRALADSRLPVKALPRVEVHGKGQRTHLWFSKHRAKTGVSSYQFYPLGYARLEDEHGCLVLARPSEDYFHLLDEYREFDELPLPFELAEDGQWTVRLVEQLLPKKQLAQFQVRTRAHGLTAEPPRKPSALPVSVSTSKLTATLKGLTHVDKGEMPFSAAKISVVDRAYPQQYWSIRKLQAFDRYGQRGKDDSGELINCQSDAGEPFHGLCRREPYWKLRALLLPNGSDGEGARRPPDYVWGPFRLKVDRVEFDGTFESPPPLYTLRKKSRGVTLSVWPTVGISNSASVDYQRPELKAASASFTLIEAGEPVLVILRRINGMAFEEWHRRLGANWSADDYHPSISDDRDVKTLVVGPRTSHVTLEFEGYRAEIVEFIVTP